MNSFDYLMREILKKLNQNKDVDRLSVWVAGCVVM